MFLSTEIKTGSSVQDRQEGQEGASESVALVGGDESQDRVAR